MTNTKQSNQKSTIKKTNKSNQNTKRKTSQNSKNSSLKNTKSSTKASSATKKALSKNDIKKDKKINNNPTENKSRSKKLSKTNNEDISKIKNSKKKNSSKITEEVKPISNVVTTQLKEKNNKKFNIIYFYLFLILYLEFITKFIAFKTTDGIILTFIFSLPIIIILFILTNIFKNKGNLIISFIITILFSFYYGFMGIFYKLFSNVFSLNTIGLASDIGEFTNMIYDIVIKNIFLILLYLIPLIILIIFKSRFKYERVKLKYILLSFIICLLLWGISLLALLPNKTKVYSAYNLYYNINSEIKSASKFGIATFTRIDIKRIIFGFDEEINIKPSNPSPKEEPKPELSYNKIEINFDDLINSEKNSSIKNILSYFKNSNPTNQNAYTGKFKGKNLIFILAEGFNMIAVDKELTPTLYKLTHEGFVFNNFYSPVFLSTTGGEFQATTGLIPTQTILYNWKKYQPNIKYAIGNSFNNIGYHVSSYHDWTYTYYARNKTMPTLGFDEYMGCGNGIEKLMNCRWLPSDIDMMNVTFPMYKNYDLFATYYVSVSGHAPYAYKSTGNSIALKNTELVKDLPYSNNVKAYLATQIEFDRALETLINSLKAEGILDNTVISFVGDHYPYTLTIDEVNELSEYKRDEIVEVNRSNFVIWNSEMKESINIDKVGSQIDILPTLLNLFGIEYDSRLIIGKDILSDFPGLAIFSNRSWVSDYGTYKNGHFTKKENKDLDNVDEYINQMNNEVNNRFIISNGIIKYDMYDYIFK